jgi:hypothetical protein
MDEYTLRVFENKVLRRIFGPEKHEETGEWRRLHNEELNDLYSSPNIIWVIKCRRTRWAGHVARVKDGRGAHSVLVGNPRERAYLEGLGVIWRIILKWILKKWDGEVWTRLIWFRIGTGGGIL